MATLRSGGKSGKAGWMRIRGRRCVGVVGRIKSRCWRSGPGKVPSSQESWEGLPGSVFLSWGCWNKTAQTLITNLFSHSSGSYKFRIKVLAGLVSLRSLSLACRWLPSCCSLFLYALLFQIFPYKDASQIQLKLLEYDWWKEETVDCSDV